MLNCPEQPKVTEPLRFQGCLYSRINVGMCLVIQTCKDDLNRESRRMYFHFSCLGRLKHSVDWE